MAERTDRTSARIQRLGYVAHLWRHDRAFRWVLPLLLVGALGLIGLLPRMWPVARTPVGRILRISGLDWLQSRALQQSARGLETAGSFPDALIAFDGAVANDPGSTAAVSGAIRCLDRLPEPAQVRLPDTADWLLHISATNQETLRWLAPLLARHGHWHWLKSRLPAKGDGADDALGALRSRSQFEEGDLEAFDSELAANPGRLKADAELALISVGRRAVQATGRPESDGLQKELELAAQSPGTRQLALRLLMDLAFARRDLWHYEQLLAAAHAGRTPGLASQTRFWRLLRGSGQGERAARLARESGMVPANVQEAELLLPVLAELGVREAYEIVRQQALTRWGNSPTLWVVVGESLVTLEDWEGLRDHAFRLRQCVQFQEALGNFSWFLEGLAEHRLGRPPRAVAAWDTFRRELPASAGLALRAAQLLDRWGLASEALAVLVRFRERSPADDALLADLQRIAYHSRDLEWFTRASRELHERHPADARVLNNLAAALIIHGDQSEAALPLTLQALQAMPNSGATVVNHAVALIQAGRATEAAPLLSRAQSLSLDPSSQGMLAYAKVCYFSATGRPDEAWRQAQLLKTDDLFPNQIQRLETMLRHKLAGRP